MAVVVCQPHLAYHARNSFTADKRSELNMKVKLKE